VRRAAPVDAPVLGQGLEQAALADGLGAAEEQEAGVFEGEVEQADQPLLDLLVEVDQQVAATDQVQLGERRVADQVLGGEHHRLAHRLVDTVALLLVGEEALQARRCEVRRDALRIDPGAGLLQGVEVDVGGEYLHGAVAARGDDALVQQDRQ